ncbi:MAG: molybdopterin oxidoreductase family protein [Dongiaceae bacterium]
MHYRDPWREPTVDTSPLVRDAVVPTTCYMCACRCGIRVHMRDGRIRYIDGNPDHPVNRGVLCAKGAAGIMTQNAPSRLRSPLLRTGARGAGEFREIGWEEAFAVATGWLEPIRKTDPRKLAFFTGRDQSQALTSWWAQQFGTPNYAAHGGFCSVNMAAAGLYSIGGSFWEFGEPDWEHTRYFMMFGVAEDHASNPIKIGLGKLKGRPDDRRAKFVSINPVRTGYSAIADEWIGIRPGTDGLFAMALIHELLRAGKIDLHYLAQYTNAAWLVVDNPGKADHGLFARDQYGRPLVWHREWQEAVEAGRPDGAPALTGRVTLPDGRSARPSFELMAERYLDPEYAPDAVAERTGVPAATIKRIARELAYAAFEQAFELDVRDWWTDTSGGRHGKFLGRPVSMYAMRGISAHSNGFHTCRALHLLQMLLGTIDVPGGFRYRPPFPRLSPPPAQPSGYANEVRPETALPGVPLGFPSGPDKLLVDANGKPLRIDKAFSWDAPLALHGMMHMVIHNAWAGDPYPIDTLFMYMANMSWNSSMNTAGTMRMLTDKDPTTGEYKIPHIIYSDAYFSEMVAYADLILPDTTYLERHDCISLLDRPISDGDSVADSIRQPVVMPDRDVRPFQDVLLDLGARLKLPGCINEDATPRYPGGYPDYMVNHERKPGTGMLAGWRGHDGALIGRGPKNPKQLERYKRNGCFWQTEIPESGRYYRFANRDYLEWAVGMGFIDRVEPLTLQLYSEPLQKFRLAAEGHGTAQPPDSERERIKTYFDPLPFWYPPFEEAAFSGEDFPLHAITQRPMHMYHSWGTQNAWLRQIQTQNFLYLGQKAARKHALADGDWVWIVSPHGRVKAPIRIMDGVNDDTVWTWNAIGKRAGAWSLSPDAPEAQKGFLLNHVISELLPPRADGYRYSNSDPVTGQAAWYDLRVRLEKCTVEEAGQTEPRFETLKRPPGLLEPLALLRYGVRFRHKADRKSQP